MGLNMAINELESAKALCKEKKLSVVKVFLSDPGRWDRYVETDKIVDLKKAAEKLGMEKMDAFFKKSRVKADGDEMYLEKAKDEADRKMFMPFVKEVKTNWIVMAKVPEGERKALEAAAKDKVTQWDEVEFDDMYATCAKCGLSWDNKKGCVGNFGPSGSPVPDLAKKYGLSMLSNVNELAESKKVLSPKDAEALLEEVRVLKEKIPAEGKMMVRRTEGTFARLESMAKCARDYKVGFYFF
jgi:hypothetical protein